MNNRTHRFIRSDRRWRAATVPGLAVLLLAPSLGAATISGRLTQCCGEPAHSGIVVMAYERLSVGIPGPRGCIRGVAERIVSAGSATTLEDGSFSLAYVPSERQPEDCSFEAGVFVEITTTDRPWGLVRSPTQPRGEDTVLEDVDLGFGPDCPELGVSFSLEGPTVVTGQPGETVLFDVFVVLGGQCLGDQIIHVEAWETIVSADGGWVVDAATSGTDAVPWDAAPPGLVSPCRSEITNLVPHPPPEAGCPTQPAAYSFMRLWRCPTPPAVHEPLPLEQGAAYRILRVTLQTVIPPPGLETSCRVYFLNGCPIALNRMWNVWYANSDVQLASLLDLPVTLRSQTTGTPFRRADTNSSGTVDISDAVGTFNYLFLGATAPSCKDAADSNADGILDISDGVNTLGYLFGGTSEIPAPGPNDCGAAFPGEPAIGCELYGNCD